MQSLGFGTGYLTINAQDYSKSDRLEYTQFDDFAEVEIISHITGRKLLQRAAFDQITNEATGQPFADEAELRTALRAGFYIGCCDGSGGGGTEPDPEAPALPTTGLLYHYRHGVDVSDNGAGKATGWDDQAGSNPLTVTGLPDFTEDGILLTGTQGLVPLAPIGPLTSFTIHQHLKFSGGVPQQELFFGTGYCILVTASYLALVTSGGTFTMSLSSPIPADITDPVLSIKLAGVGDGGDGIARFYLNAMEVGNATGVTGSITITDLAGEPGTKKQCLDIDEVGYNVGQTPTEIAAVVDYLLNAV